MVRCEINKKMVHICVKAIVLFFLVAEINSDPILESESAKALT